MQAVQSRFRRSTGFIAVATLINFYAAGNTFAESTQVADSTQSTNQETQVSPATDATTQNPESKDTDQAKADTSNDENLLGAVTVKAKKLTTALPDRPSSSVYGTDTSLLDTPRAVSEISEEQLQRDSIKTADDLVKYAPSITRGGGQNVSIAPLIRGQNSEVFQDGQRAYNVRHPFNINAYEGADIVSGPPSEVFGPASRSGGYINYLTKKPNFDEQKSQISVQLGTWVPSGGSYLSSRVTYDTTGPINDTLAYRFSVTPQKADDYYKNISNSFTAFYGALAWKPTDNIRVDWNASSDNYYDFNVTHGLNRTTQSLVDNGQYYAGRATPIIQVGNTNTYYSPVYASGAYNSTITGWALRTKDASTGKYIAGAITSTNPFGSAATPGTVKGWVYDPTLPGNGLVKLAPNDFSNPNDQNTARRDASQLKFAINLTPNWSILNSSYYQYSHDTTNSVGSFLAQFRDNIFDNRIELKGKSTFNLLGVDIKDNSNTGIAYRYESFDSLAANNSFTIAPYDLTAPLGLKTPAGLYGLATPGTSGSWIGTANVPQLTSFGYIKFPAMYPVGGGLYAEVGGSPKSGGAVYTGVGNWSTTSIFTQQNLVFNDKFGLNVGLNSSYINAKISNPLDFTPALTRSDEQSFWLPSYQASVYYKPLDNTTLYYSYDHSYALNTGGFADVLTWNGSGNTLNPLAFRSTSQLNEVGVKSDLIPNKLFVSLSGYRQLRALSPDNNTGAMTFLQVKGIESAIRWQATDRLSAGANLAAINAIYTNAAYPTGFFSENGFVADNATVFADGNALTGKANPGRIQAPAIPKYSVSSYLDYQLPSGFGAQVSGWWTSKWYTNISRTVLIPNEHNIDLTLYYREKKWDGALRFLNITNQKNFTTGLTGGQSEFVTPLQPLAVQATFAYRF